MRSHVAFLNVRAKSTVQSTVAEAMTLCRWENVVKGSGFFLKVNLLSKEVVPGQCTSPWVFEGVLQTVRKTFPHARILFGDCDVSTAKQLDSAVKNWGFDAIGRRYGAKFINLSKSETVNRSFGKIFENIQLPRVLLDIDNIITIPVIKTHCITPFTGALKNQWGLLPRVRFKYHPVVNDAIGEINGYFKDKLKMGVADLTVAMEGPGPRVGTPKICNVVMASTDLVALDTAIVKYMGMDPNEIEFILRSERHGIGSRGHRIVGDPFYVEPFQPGRGKDYFVYRWRDRIKTVPCLGQFILGNTFTFRFFGFFAMLYYRLFWYTWYGRKYAEYVCRHTFYREEFMHLIKK